MNPRCALSARTPALLSSIRVSVSKKGELRELRKDVNGNGARQSVNGLVGLSRPYARRSPRPCARLTARRVQLRCSQGV